MNTASIIKVGAAAAVTAAASGGLVVAHERVFLAAQPRQQRIDRTWLTAAEFAGVGAAGTALGALTTRGTVRAAIVASGAALIGSSLLGAAYATATARDATAATPPFGQRLADLAANLPPLAVRSGETLLAGTIVGGIGGAIRSRSVGGTLATAGVGALVGAVGGAIAFGLVGADR